MNSVLHVHQSSVDALLLNLSNHGINVFPIGVINNTSELMI